MARSIKLKAFQFILFSSLHSALLPVARLLLTAHFYRGLFDEIYASFEYVCHFMRFFHEHSQNSIKDVKYTRLTSAQKKKFRKSLAFCVVVFRIIKTSRKNLHEKYAFYFSIGVRSNNIGLCTRFPLQIHYAHNIYIKKILEAKTNNISLTCVLYLCAICNYR